MLWKPHRVLVLVNLFSGCIGGALGAIFLASNPVVALSGQTDVQNAMQEEIPKTIIAQEFRLIDAKGQVRALLSFSENDQPFLHLIDEFEHDRVWIGISNDTGVAVRDRDGKTRLLLSVDEQGEPSLVVRDRQHRTKSFHP